jgi:hypothetical protein
VSITIDGSVTSNLGAATRTLAMQMPHFRRIYPEISACHHGTINVQLDQAIRIENPDFTTTPIAWHPQFPQHSEVFSFLRVLLELPIGSTNDAWIYIPHGSPNRADPYLVEVIAKWLGPQTLGTRCRLHVNKNHTECVLVVI